MTYTEWRRVPPDLPDKMDAKTMNPDDEGDHPGVAKIKAMWDRGEFETLDRMIKVWEGLERLGIIGDMVKRFLIWCGIIFAAYFAFTEYLLAWVKKAAGQ